MVCELNLFSERHGPCFSWTVIEAEACNPNNILASPEALVSFIHVWLPLQAGSRAACSLTQQRNGPYSMLNACMSGRCAHLHNGAPLLLA